MRSKVTGILACLTLITLSATVTMANLTDGLVAYWPLDEGDGATTADLSGNGNDGTLDLPEWDNDGKFGSALNFDGVDDYVDCGNPGVLDFGSDFTLSVWIKTDVAADATIFGNGGDDGGGIRYRLSTTDSGLVHWLFDDDSSKQNPTGNIAVVDGEWHHIVGMRRDGTDMRVYVDGVEDMGVTNNAKSTIPADYDLSGTSQHNANIGAIRGHGDDLPKKFFIGLIDDVAIWDRAITEEEIAELATGSISIAVEPNGKLTITWGSIKN